MKAMTKLGITLAAVAALIVANVAAPRFSWVLAQDSSISGLTSATAPTGAELVPLVQGGTTKKTTAAVLGHQPRVAHVRMTSDDNTVNATAGFTLSFDEAAFDTDSFWSAGAPTRLTIPAGLGITYVVVTAQVQVSSTTADTSRSFQITHNNSADVTQRIFRELNVESGGTSYSAILSSGPIAVSAGDYFVAVFTEETDTSVTIEGDGTGRAFMSIHVIGMSPV